jgi:hypothetical protein
VAFKGSFMIYWEYLVGKLWVRVLHFLLNSALSGPKNSKPWMNSGKLFSCLKGLVLIYPVDGNYGVEICTHLLDLTRNSAYKIEWDANKISIFTHNLKHGSILYVYTCMNLWLELDNLWLQQASVTQLVKALYRNRRATGSIPNPVPNSISNPSTARHEIISSSTLLLVNAYLGNFAASYIAN